MERGNSKGTSSTEPTNLGANAHSVEAETKSRVDDLVALSRVAAAMASMDMGFPYSSKTLPLNSILAEPLPLSVLALAEL